MYLLSDSDLQPLGFIEKENPRHQKWNSMKQYLASQVGGSLEMEAAASQPMLVMLSLMF